MPSLVLLFLVAVTYNDILSHEFLTVWDDPLYITDNPFIRGFDWLNLKTAFTRYFVGNFAPVQMISYMLDYTLWGMKPSGYFLANVIYHFISGILLYSLLFRFDISKCGALIGAAIFLVHPAQVENVAWLSQRKSLLAILLFLAAFHLYLYYRDRDNSRRLWYSLSIAAFILSLLAKSAAVILPIALLYLDTLNSQSGGWVRRNQDKIPYLLSALAIGVISVLAQSPEHGGGRISYPDNPLLVMPLTMLPVFMDYLRILFWPSPDRLCLIYDPPFRTGIDGEVLTALCVLFILVTVGVWLHRCARPALFWYGLFFIGLLPVSQIIPLLTIMNDRYLNFPLLGIAGLAGYTFDRQRELLRSPLSIGLLLAGTFGVIASLSTVSYGRSLVWRDAISLFSDTVPKVSNSHKPWLMLGQAYEASGDSHSAEISFEQSEITGPLTETDYIILGNIFIYRGETERVRAYLKWLRRSNGHDSTIQFLERAL